MAARAREAEPDVFIGAQRKPLRRRVAKPPEDAPRSDSALDAHVSVSEWGNAMPSGRLQAVRITASDSGG